MVGAPRHGGSKGKKHTPPILNGMSVILPPSLAIIESKTDQNILA
jgi:hypothetical protein